MEALKDCRQRKLCKYRAASLNKESRWILASIGPDLIFDYQIYDPTNGTISRGDIFRGSDFQVE